MATEEFTEKDITEVLKEITLEKRDGQLISQKSAYDLLKLVFKYTLRDNKNIWNQFKDKW